MELETRIADMRRRIQRWLYQQPPGADGSDTVEALDADITALDAELQALFSGGKSTQEAYEALREQAVLRTVLESMVEGVIVADMEGRLLVFNSAAREMLGQGPTDAAPEDWSAEFGLFHGDGKTRFAASELPLSRALQGESVGHEELVVKIPGESGGCHVSATARPLLDGAGKQVGAVVVFHDITDTKAVERELRRARASAEETARAKSAFLANMSHEIRTPLTAVLGFTDLMLDPKLGESEKLNYIQAVRRNGEHLLALINDVLDLSKINADQVQVESIDCSLHQIIHEVASIIRVRAHEKGIDFDIDYETPIPARIQSDSMRVRQILLNLLSNAIKFTPEGEVRLKARCLDIGTESSRVEIAVTDTGIGLRAEEIDRLFQPFQQANPSTTRQYGGTGLGLTICRSLAQVLGGEVRVSSTPGEGSTFTFILYQPIDKGAEMIKEPGVTADEPDVETATPEASGTLAGRILLAEDGIDNQVLISTILRRRGLEVDIADNGESAVTRALAARDSNTFYDLILMDMQMPILDGYGATAKLRSKGYSGAIIALTAHAMTGERERCLAAGCDDYLSKPIDRPVLLAAIESHLHRIRGGVPDTGGATGGNGGECPVPIYSGYADDPDMAELVADFAERLPLLLHDIRQAREVEDMKLLERLAHQLKGAAGGVRLYARQ